MKAGKMERQRYSPLTQEDQEWNRVLIQAHQDYIEQYVDPPERLEDD